MWAGILEGEVTGAFKEGTFRITSESGELSWYRVEMTRYPTVAWWITNCTFPTDGTPGVIDKVTRRRLSAEAWAKLEAWL